MGLLDVVNRLRGEDGVRKLAETTAVHCIDEVWDRVVGRIINMRVLEARGYIRARGIRVIRASVDRQISSQPTLIRMQRSRLINQAVDIVIGMVMPRLAAAQQTAPPLLLYPISQLLDIPTLQVNLESKSTEISDGLVLHQPVHCSGR